MEFSNEWTKHKELHRKYKLNPKILQEIIDLYGENFENLVEYEPKGTTKDGHIIYKVKQNETINK